MSDDNQDKPNGLISKLGAVVLCGGKSTRLGVDKTRLDFKGSTFLGQVVNQVRQACEKVVVVVGDTDLSFHQLPDDIVVACDQASGKGPLEGIRVGLEKLAADDTQTGCDYAFVTSCDVPLLQPALIGYLFDQLNGGPAIVPVQGDRVFGMTAIYRTQFHVEIGERIKANNLRVSELATAFEANCIDAAQLREVDPNLDSLTNINSVDDYRSLLKRLGLRCPPELAQAIGLDDAS